MPAARYEIVDVPFASEDETWDEFILRTMASDGTVGSSSGPAGVHMMLQYWLVKASRVERLSILKTHVDVSGVLVARLQPRPSGLDLPLGEQLFKFIMPCTRARVAQTRFFQQPPPTFSRANRSSARAHA